MPYDRDYLRNQASAKAAAIGSFSTRVYGWLSIGLVLSAAIAYGVFASGLFIKILPFWWVLTLGTFGLSMAIGTMINRLSVPALALMFLGYSALEGVFFGTVLPAFAYSYGGGVIWTAFATAAGIFGIAVVYGIFTKQDLTSLGKIFTFALIGLVSVTLIYFVLSFFMNVTWMNLLISYIGLVLFVGLTAYDAQQIRYFSTQAESNSILSYKLSLMMALKMYINVVMIFWYLLQIFSSNRK